MDRFSVLPSRRLLSLAAWLVFSLSGSAWAQQPPSPAPAAPQVAPETEEERLKRQNDLKVLEEAMNASAQAQKRLEAEIEEIRTDRAKLNATLIETASRVRDTEDRIRGLEQRLQTLISSEAAIRRSLESRRGVIVEVFASLQRMGRRPPPAVLVRPEDMLEAVRASIILGAVLPELRAEAEVLASDLAELVRLKEAIATDRSTLNTELGALNTEQQRLTALMAARQGRMAEVERSIGTEREKTAELARQAGTLKELIDRMEAEISGAQKAAEEARKAAEAQEREAKERFAQAAFRDPARLAPKIPFSEARGLLPRPVSGTVALDFGAADGYGGTTRGISITTRPKAAVVSPADGWVAFAGPFRSYGRLLIINAGGGYYILLAGMDQINVDVGQFVLAGEPVATMGDSPLMSLTGSAIEKNDPVLYVEFRKDGGSIDPGPWWAKSQSEKVRG
ncbi:murein hydrolase activator EnvC family protein [Microvirga guangxiensis]|uniref:Septal ring factor EnvC, activator of murein hydrolases AmiA and AmiB n=1 Tax=Microvirga guangxiensis TaxID=549386 RepID=A0A1G5H419_9HYPH|nr:peptidoglycan DD-metalloendopeptidase family protein [Microvirga guangxiensis]SCY58411.1 Septal ring factor EnvC, activator of murein hydrolases AmiA and AmiB [Microvirga guangxiensis]